MSEPWRQRRNFRLGPWRINPEESTISAEDRIAKIDYKSMDVLCLLAEHSQSIVSRETISDQVWPDTIATDDLVTVAVSTLRRELRDDAKQPTYIRTLPKRGYSLLVRPEFDCEPFTPGAPFPNRRRNVSIVAIGVIVLALGLVLLGSTADRSSSMDSIGSIAVVPLKNISGDPSQQYLADGITDALTTRLARRGELRVAPSASVQRLVQSGQPMEAIARALDVDALVEGTVQISERTLRVHVRLVDPGGTRHIWADEFERPLEDLFTIQSELAAAVAARVEGRAVTIEAPPPVNPDAYDLYLKARYLRNREANDDLAQAVKSLEEAIDLSPDFAPAYTLLAELRFTQVEKGLLPPPVGFAQGREAAELALRLDPDLPDAHAARAIAAFSLDWDFALAGREFSRAVAGGVVSITTLKWYVRYLVVVGRTDEALAMADRIQELDPYSYVNLSHVLALSYAGRHSMALDRLRELESLLPASPLFDVTFAQVHAQAGNHDTAMDSFVEYAEAVPWPAVYLNAIRDALESGGTDGVSLYLGGRDSPLPSAALRARFNVMIGRDDIALSLLEEAVANRDMTVLWVNADSCFDRLRPSPRFQNIVSTIGLAR
jgi:TolB-like protein/DNA-binding winged helix-turn-helix (wHTH) protein/Tfp pilus assembly protein PilF